MSILKRQPCLYKNVINPLQIDHNNNTQYEQRSGFCLCGKHHLCVVLMPPGNKLREKL